ncbi:SEC-C metal-binding domain-containing protein [Xanthomonas perforans]
MTDAIHKINSRDALHVGEEAQAQAARLGVSLNAYILFAVSEQVKRTRQELSGPVTAPKPTPRPASAAVSEWDAPFVTPVKRPQAKVGRNEDCPCGSGRKAKHCHPEWT